jgi:hypothetical protein
MGRMGTTSRRLLTRQLTHSPTTSMRTTGIVKHPNPTSGHDAYTAQRRWLRSASAVVVLATVNTKNMPAAIANGFKSAEGNIRGPKLTSNARPRGLDAAPEPNDDAKLRSVSNAHTMVQPQHRSSGTGLNGN